MKKGPTLTIKELSENHKNFYIKRPIFIVAALPTASAEIISLIETRKRNKTTAAEVKGHET